MPVMASGRVDRRWTTADFLSCSQLDSRLVQLIASAAYQE